MHYIYDFALLGANSSLAPEAGRGSSLSWAIIIFMTILGVSIALLPAKRTYEVKKDKD